MTEYRYRKPGAVNFWTAYKIERLIELNKQGCDNTILAERLGCSAEAVKDKLNGLKIPSVIHRDNAKAPGHAPRELFSVRSAITKLQRQGEVIFHAAVNGGPVGQYKFNGHLRDADYIMERAARC